MYPNVAHRCMGLFHEKNTQYCVIFGQCVRSKPAEIALAEALNHGFVFVAVLSAVGGAEDVASRVATVLAGIGEVIISLERRES